MKQYQPHWKWHGKTNNNYKRKKIQKQKQEVMYYILYIIYSSLLLNVIIYVHLSSKLDYCAIVVFTNVFAFEFKMPEACLARLSWSFYWKKKITLHLVPLSILIYFAVPRRWFSSAAPVETNLIPVQMVVSKNWQSDQILSGMMCSCLHK